MTINKEKFETMEIDDVFIIQDIEDPTQQMVTCFYVSKKGKDMEWNFIIKNN